MKDVTMTMIYKRLSNVKINIYIANKNQQCSCYIRLVHLCFGSVLLIEIAKRKVIRRKE